MKYFKKLAGKRVYLSPMSVDDVAIRCYTKTGFKVIGRRRQSYYLKGKFYDEVYMDILRNEWYGRG